MMLMKFCYQLWIFSLHSQQYSHHVILHLLQRGIKAEAIGNSKMVLIANVDIDLLQELNKFGSIRNLNDRRKDIYEVVKKSK